MGHGEPQRKKRAAEMKEDELTKIIIGCAIEVHRRLGPGLLESTYTKCLNFEMVQAGLYVQTELALPLTYKDIDLNIGYRLDFLVEKSVVIEVKSIEAITDVHIAQVLTYLKLSNAHIGLLINFNVLKLVTGIKRLLPRVI
jgi:GxxExxY protein